MNSKQMSVWSGIWLLFSVIDILIEIISGKSIPSLWFFIIMSTIFNVGSSIMNKLEKQADK